MKIVIFLLGLLSANAFAQSAALSFTTPTQYSDGSVLPASAITGYDVQCSGWTPTGGARTSCTQFAAVVLASVSTGSTLTGTIPGAGGTACFQVRTKTASAVSPWTVERCKTFATLVPNPPGNVTVAVVIGINMAPVYKLTSTGKRSADPAGFIPVGEQCTGNVLLRYRGVNFRRVESARVLFWNVVPDTNVAAACT